MTIAQLYEREPASRTFEVFHLNGCDYEHMPELRLWDVPRGANTRVETRWTRYVDVDERRIWALGTVWLDDRPFMAIQNAGREGDDHARRFVTDAEAYYEAVAYLRSLMPADCQAFQVADPNADLPELTSFYGHSLEGRIQQRFGDWEV